MMISLPKLLILLKKLSKEVVQMMSGKSKKILMRLKLTLLRTQEATSNLKINKNLLKRNKNRSLLLLHL
jgi:hypothetical protein